MGKERGGAARKVAAHSVTRVTSAQAAVKKKPHSTHHHVASLGEQLGASHARVFFDDSRSGGSDHEGTKDWSRSRSRSRSRERERLRTRYPQGRNATTQRVPRRVQENILPTRAI